MRAERRRFVLCRCMCAYVCVCVCARAVLRLGVLPVTQSGRGRHEGVSRSTALIELKSICSLSLPDDVPTTPKSDKKAEKSRRKRVNDFWRKKERKLNLNNACATTTNKFDNYKIKCNSFCCASLSVCVRVRVCECVCLCICRLECQLTSCKGKP